MVGQLFDDGGKLMQGPTNDLVPCFQLPAAPCSQLLVPNRLSSALTFSSYIVPLRTQCRTLKSGPAGW
jgi:hypothetical protein